MRKPLISLALLVTISFFHGTVQADYTFSLISSDFKVSGSWSQLFVWPNPDGSYNEYEQSGGYGVTSSTPVAGESAATWSEASYSGVSCYARFGGPYPDSVPPRDAGTTQMVSSYADTTATINFRPDFIGQDLGIDFTAPLWVKDIAHMGVSVTDITSSVVIFSRWATRDVSNWWAYPSVDLRTASLIYDDWDPTHEYQLKMWADARFESTWLEGFGRAGFETNMIFSNVPEPFTMLFLGCSLLGLAGVRRFGK
jgi:hypothetical protein